MRIVISEHDLAAEELRDPAYAERLRQLGAEALTPAEVREVVQESKRERHEHPGSLVELMARYEGGRGES